MEDVLDVYTRPYDPRFPQVCLDETSRQLLADVAPPLPAVPGHPAQEDYEYARNGVCNLFLVCEPLCGRRHVTVSDRRTRLDWAYCIQEVAAWEAERHAAIRTITWRFTTADARTKLKHLYPVCED